MTKYDIIFESLQEKVDSGELTFEDAEVLNDIAFEKYSNDDTDYEEVFEATRLAKEIDKKQTNVANKINELKTRKVTLTKLLSKTTDTAKRNDIENQIDDIEILIDQLQKDHESINTFNTIKYGKEFAPTASKIKAQNKAINQEDENISRQLKKLTEENNSLKREKKILKRISNQSKIVKNKDAIRDLEYRKLARSIMDGVSMTRTDRKYDKGIKQGSEVKQKQTMKNIQPSFRRANHHVQQADSLKNRDK